jgi:hypothetical protein
MGPARTVTGATVGPMTNAVPQHPLRPPPIDDLGAIQVMQAREYLRDLHRGGDVQTSIAQALAKLDGALDSIDKAGNVGRPGIHRDGDDGINAALHRAIGLDPATHHGFRLSVMPGEWPMVEAIPLLPVAADGAVERTFVDHLAAVGQQMLLMPADDPAADLLGQRDEAFDFLPGLVSLDGAGIDVNEAYDLPAGARVVVLVPKDQQAYAEAYAQNPPEARQSEQPREYTQPVQLDEPI